MFRETLFAAILRSICTRTGLPAVVTDDTCKAEWTLGANRLFIQLNPSGSSLNVRAYVTDNPVVEVDVSVLDQDAMVNGVVCAAQRIMSA